MHDAKRTLSDRIDARLDAEGWRWRAVGIDRVREVWSGIVARRRAGELDASFFEERLAPYTTACTDIPADIKTLLLVAIRDPWVRFRFGWRGSIREAWVPPTFLQWRETVEAVRRAAFEALGEERVTVAPATVPVKPLAVRSGLARYGRNNITYVGGWGSYVRLLGLYTSVPLPEGAWQEMTMLPLCAQCGACVRACPTGALSEERFLLRAERCLTYWNEMPPDCPFPSWIEPRMHHCLVGCARCQSACPENRGAALAIDAGAPFTEAETQVLLEMRDPEAVPPALGAKLDAQGVSGLIEALPRNLAALLDAPPSGD